MNVAAMTLSIATVEELQAAVREQPRISVRAGGTKSALTKIANVDISRLSGVIEYEPTEYTFTARAATPLNEIQGLLATHHQFMPFDPMLVRAGATIGGAIATGISGPGRFRYGGLRDFLLGVRLVNGEGDVVRGGGKVVKNAAGFDIPKLMVGSLGQFGIITEATFKVFPQPECYATLRVEHKSLEAALADLLRIATSAAEAACLDLIPSGTLLVRVGGIATALEQRVDRLRQFCRGTIQVLHRDDDLQEWDVARELSWRADKHRLVRLPVAPRDIPFIEQRLVQIGAGPRRYSVGGHLLWLCWPDNFEWSALVEILQSARRSALVVIGDCEKPLLNYSTNVFGERLLEVFDPANKFALRPMSVASNERVH
jgi:glycolate oxidase FAD binding subunit